MRVRTQLAAGPTSTAPEKLHANGGAPWAIVLAWGMETEVQDIVGLKGAHRRAGRLLVGLLRTPGSHWCCGLDQYRLENWAA
jgi:hypothetical protein